MKIDLSLRFDCLNMFKSMFIFWNIGASGGVYSLISAHLATLLLNWKEDMVILRRRIRPDKTNSAKDTGTIVRYVTNS